MSARTRVKTTFPTAGEVGASGSANATPHTAAKANMYPCSAMRDKPKTKTSRNNAEAIKNN